MLVAMLATFASAREPFKSKLILCNFHDVNWRLVVEDMELILARTTLAAFYVLLQLSQRQCELYVPVCPDPAL